VKGKRLSVQIRYAVHVWLIKKERVPSCQASIFTAWVQLDLHAAITVLAVTMPASCLITFCRAG